MTQWRSFFISAMSVALSLVAFSAYAEAISLEDAMTRAYQNNPTIQAERASLRALDENAYQAFSGWMPNVSLDATRGALSTRRATIGQHSGNTESESARVTQSIFKGGETISKMKQADATIEAGRARLKDVEQQVLLSVVQAYTDVAYGKEVLDLSKNNEKVLQEHLEVAQERFKLGEVTKTDVAQAQARLARATSDRIKSEGDLQISRAALKRAVGEETDTLNTAPTIPELPAKEQDELITIARVEHPSLIAARFSAVAAKHTVSVAKSTLLPSLTLEAERGRDETPSSLTSGKVTTDDGQILLRLSVPLYQSGAEYSSVRQAKEREAQSNETSQATERSVIENVIKSYREFNIARSSISSNDAVVNAAKIALSGVEKEAEVGSRTTLDVLDAEQELFSAQVSLADAKRQEVVSAYTILSSVGRFTPETLNLKVSSYDAEENYQRVKHKIIGF